jgi:hypothetical protein
VILVKENIVQLPHIRPLPALMALIKAPSLLRAKLLKSAALIAQG